MAFQNGWRGPNIVSDGLVLYLDAGSPNSYRSVFGTTWKDISENNYNGTLINGPIFDSTSGGSIVFDGINDYITFTNLALINGISNFSFSLSFNSTQNTFYSGIFGDTGGGTPRYTLEFNLGNLRWWVNNNIVDTPLTYSDGIWHFATLTQDSLGNYKCYVDGNLVVNTTQTTLSLSNSNFRIGNWGDTTFSYQGKIGTFQIYSRVLSASEVLQNYNAQKSRFGL